MISINESIFIPTKEIAEWCINQHVIVYANAGNSLFIALAVAWILLIADVFLKELSLCKKLHGKLTMLARILISIILIIYLVFFKYNIIPVLQV